MSSGYDYFISQGYTPIQSAGIMGNLFGESNLNPNAIGDNGAAYGIAQWHPDRQANFQSVFGIPIQQSSLDQQYQFVNWELNNTESRAGNILRQQTTLAGATGAFMNNYERPANSSSFGNRLSAATDILSKGADIVSKGTSILSGVSDALKGVVNKVPVVGDIAQGLGLTSDCGWICQFRKWLDESHFWQRTTIVVLALIMILAAFYLFGTGGSKYINKAIGDSI